MPTPLTLFDRITLKKACNFEHLSAPAPLKVSSQPWYANAAGIRGVNVQPLSNMKRTATVILKYWDIFLILVKMDSHKWR